MESPESPLLNIVLFQPEIPQNTGNIGRTCVALGIKLWMVRPIGFRLDSSQLKRSGMDYWEHLDWELVDSWSQLSERLSLDRAWLFTKFATRPYTAAKFQRGDTLVFGNESSGVTELIQQQLRSRAIILPMRDKVRCLNLATSAGIAAYEAARQLGQFEV
ncbi:MAG TPA: tRNA (uridine(34)/cytosine(34)/5-carboxymethylaminomethyluridine(34)-2'-O)-methyltransferase TrmL [Planctomycetaceae bacterium]|nr:tRNA (uridine(34)/cytosine(34)/5-carboxymethylaminomethyluridine(34)-2'-O)-methyltransferase TrmL [Planctomycetaceae bacterium]